jgi:NADH-quinone oxidoreductase subunit H
MFVTALACVLVDGAPAGVVSALNALADVSNFVVVAALVAAPVYVVATMLKPTKHQRFTIPSAARFAAAAGGTKPSPMQA